MSSPTPIAIIGFSPFERQALASFFGADLLRRRHQAFHLVDELEQARFIVADADQPGAVALLRQIDRDEDAVFVGAQAPEGAVAWLMRPINPGALRNELEALRSQREFPNSGPLPLTLPSSALAARTLGDWGAPAVAGPRVAGRRADDGRGQSLQQQQLQAAEQRRRERLAARRSGQPVRALLVDDSEIARVFLGRQLELYGLEVDVAGHSDEALDMLLHQVYGLVFLDVDLGRASTVDGLTLCHTIRQHLGLPASRVPVLVMVSAHHDPVDQVRGALAGADAYLAKPLDAAALDRLLREQGLLRRDTAPAPLLDDLLPPPPAPRPPLR